jgi:hypothetical protein
LDRGLDLKARLVPDGIAERPLYLVLVFNRAATIAKPQPLRHNDFMTFEKVARLMHHGLIVFPARTRGMAVSGHWTETAPTGVSANCSGFASRSTIQESAHSVLLVDLSHPFHLRRWCRGPDLKMLKDSTGSFKSSLGQALYQGVQTGTFHFDIVEAATSLHKPSIRRDAAATYSASKESPTLAITLKSRLSNSCCFSLYSRLPIWMGQ